MAAAVPSAPWMDDLVEASSDSMSLVYLITFARILADRLEAGGVRNTADLSREEVRSCVLDAWENPIQGPRGGRPRGAHRAAVAKIVVFKESHADGDAHFHVAVRLYMVMRFLATQRTLLMRHKLVAHFSTTHTLW